MSRHRMSAGDVAWLHMDRPTNRMIVTSVMWTDEPLDWVAVRQVLRDRLIARYPRFSQRVVEFGTAVWWEDCENFDLADNLYHHVLAPPGGRDELARFTSSLLHRQLPMGSPLWEMHFVDNYRGGSAIVSRIHHCIADGIALSQVLLSLCTSQDEPAEPPARRRLTAARRIGTTVLDDLAHPRRIADVLEHAMAGTRAFGRIVTMAPDVRTCLRGDIGTEKRVLWSDPFSLEQVRTRAHAEGVTVNEFVLGAISGALRSYLSREDGEAPDIRAIIPVNLRPLDTPLPRSLGNRFGLVYLPLPVSHDDPADRLQRIHHDSRAILGSPEGVLAFDLLELFGHTLYGVEQSLIDLFASKGSAVITNVAGPTTPLFLAGRRLRGTVAWPPESGNVALGLSVVSLDGQILVGVLADAHLVRDPAFLLGEIERELTDALIAAVV